MNQYLKARIPDLQSIIVAIIGLISAWYIPLALFAKHNHLHHIHNLQYAISSHDWTTVTIVAGVLLICSAYYLLLRKRLAYQITFVALLCLIVAHLARHANPIVILPIVLMTAWLYHERNQYNGHSNTVRVRSGLTIGIGIILFAFCFGTIGLTLLSAGDLSLSESLKNTFLILSGSSFSLGNIEHPDAIETIIHTLYILDLASFTVILIGLFRPIHFAFGEGEADRTLVADLIKKFGTSNEDFLKLWPQDKNYFFNKTRNAVIAYGLIGNTVVILGEPIGQASTKSKIIKSFTGFCQENGWRVIAINLNQADKELYKVNGLTNELFVGSEAYIDNKKFQEETIHSKHFRYIINRAKREGISFDWWENPSTEQIEAVRQVSKAWLGENGRRDYRFFMSPFSSSYIKRCKLGVVKQNDKVIAYANILPHNKTVKSSTIDHMRYLPSADLSAMHFLLANIIMHEYEIGQKFFNLGLSPLKETTDNSAKMKALLRYAKRLGARFYSFEGLSQFKNKFEPDWRPQYIAFSGSPASYLAVLNSSTMIGSTNTRLRAQIKIVTIIILLILAVIYISLS